MVEVRENNIVAILHKVGVERDPDLVRGDGLRELQRERLRETLLRIGAGRMDD